MKVKNHNLGVLKYQYPIAHNFFSKNFKQIIPIKRLDSGLQD